MSDSEDVSIIIEDAEDNDKPGPSRAECKPNAVSYEQKWFNEPYDRPDDQVVDSHIPQDLVKKFQDLAWNSPHDRMVPGYGMMPKELGTVSSDGRRGWLMSCHFYWLCNQLNKQQKKTRCFVLDPSLSKETISKQLNGTVKDETRRIVFVMSVGRQDEGNVFFGDNKTLGDHWSVAVVDTLRARVHYCDTLGWPAPDRFLAIVTRYTKYFGFSRPNDLKLLMAHEPNEEQHECCTNCSNYPLQTCSDICGVIAMVCIAIATCDSKLFDLLLKPINEKINVYLTNPTDYSSYLRHVIICWLSSSHVDVKNISLKSDYDPYSQNKTSSELGVLKRKLSNQINGDDGTHSKILKMDDTSVSDLLKGDTISHDFVQDCLHNYKISKITENSKKKTEEFFAHLTFNNSFQRHQDDNISVKMYVNEFKGFPEQDNPLIMYKPYGSTGNPKIGQDDIAIGIQNNFQKETMMLYGKKCICIETHQAKSPKFHIVTVSVVYEGSHEVPCAWLISNRNDDEVYKMFFEALKTRVGNLYTEVFIGDMGFMFYRAWIKVFPKPGQRMFGAWEVIRVLHTRLSNFIETSKGLKEVKELISVFPSITEPTKFRRYASCFLDVVKPVSDEFHEYIRTKYIQENKEYYWAPCQRRSVSESFIPFLSPFSQTLDIIDYSSGVNMDRLDTHLHKLLQLIKYYEMKLNIVINPSEKKKRSALNDLSIGHQKSQQNQYDIYRPGSRDEWHIRATDGSDNCYVVESLGNQSDSQLKCEQCQLGLQQYVCMCSKYLLLAGGCPHIHSIHLFEKFSKEFGFVDPLARDEEEDDTKDLQFSKDDMLNDCKSLSDIIQQCENKVKLGNLFKAIKTFQKEFSSD